MPASADRGGAPGDRRGAVSEALRRHRERLLASGADPDVVDAAVAALEGELTEQLAPDLHREVVDRLPDAAVVYRGDRMLYANPAARALLGYPDDAALLATSPLDAIDPLDREHVRARVARLEAGLAVEPRDTRFARPDGTVVVLEVASQPIQFEGGRAILAVGRDVAARREAQERRLQADRALSIATLAAGVAHEINNPLTFVVTNVGYAIHELRRFADEPDPARLDELVEALTEAQEGAERIRVIARDLRGFSRLEDTRDERVDVRKVLTASVNLAASEIRPRAALARDLRDVPPVLGSEGRLGQVFLNLLVNAAQSLPVDAPERNVVAVACYADGADVVVAVRDTGSGMTPDVRARIFDPFFTTKPAGVGTGLGLSICQRIVTGLGGDISVETELGRGSTFRVRLPAVS